MVSAGLLLKTINLQTEIVNLCVIYVFELANYVLSKQIKHFETFDSHKKGSKLNCADAN